jgi:uncharacterized membrane protein (UPF0127 family)
MARLDTKTLWLITAAAAAVILLLQFCPTNRRAELMGLQTSGGVFAITVADSPERQIFALGMLNRFRPGQGLLLIFDDVARPRVWSKTLQVEADLLWLDETRQVVDRDLGARPCAVDPCPDYTPERGAVSVLLLPPGAGNDAAFAVGQTAFLRPLKPAP